MESRWAAVLIMTTIGAPGCMGGPSTPAAPTLEYLQAKCRGETPEKVRFDHESCVQAAHILRQQGAEPEVWLAELKRGCGGDGPACVELGIHYLEGRVTPVDFEAASKHFASGCMKRDNGACGWWHLLSLRTKPSPTSRFLEANEMHFDCQTSTAPGWVCTNFGVALSCGLFGYNDLPGGRRVLSRACKRGDDRACDLWMKMRADQSLTPTCELIGGDPKHPVELGLDLTPMAWPVEKGSPFE